MKNSRCLFVIFDGHFSVEDAQLAISTITSMIQAEKGKLNMVWECTRMSGYDHEAREAWQDFIKGIEPRVLAIHLISKRALVRSGAMVIGIFAGIKITPWTDLEQFQAAN